MKYIIMFFFLVCLCLSVTASDADDSYGSVKITVTTSDNTKATGVIARINSLNKTAVTDEEGVAVFSRINPGIYTIEVSLIGYSPVQKQVAVVAGKAAIMFVQLSIGEKQLEAVIVKSGIRFANRQTDMVARMPLRNLENPQVYSVVSASLLKEQMITGFDDALKNAPGLNRLWTSTGRASDGGGYYSLRGFSLQARVVNGVAGATNGTPDPSNIERIEVIKGPSGTLFGSTLVSFGGLINTVTKKPALNSFGEISLTAGSYGLTRLTADINMPLGKDNKLLFRTNASYHHENSWQDAGFKRTYFLAPSITYNVNDRLSFDLNANVFAAEQTNAEMLFLTRTAPLKILRPEDMKIDYSRSFTSNDITIKNPAVNIDAAIRYKLGGGWISQTLLSRSNRTSNGFYFYLSILPGDSSLARLVTNQNSYTTLTDIQQNFIGDFRIGVLRNRVVAGVDFLSNLSNNTNMPYITYDTVVYTRNDVRYGNLNRLSVEQKLNNGIPTKTSSLTNTYSMYVSDVLDITERLHAMASLRVDRFDNRGSYNQRSNLTTGAYAQTAFSPKFGATYELLPQHFAVFVNYMNGFSNLAPVIQPDGNVNVFKPQQANQWEGGVKTEVLGGKVTGTLTYYNILVKDVTRPHSTLVGFTVQDGNIRSKGFEADIIANLFEGCNLVAGYSHNEAINEQTDKNTNGLRPVSAGPKDLANLWFSYKAMSGKLQGTGLGFGGNYASENIITNNAINGQFILPSYTVLNATVFYDQPAFRIGLKVDNITNKEYWGGWTTVEPQMRRRVSLNLSFKW